MPRDSTSTLHQKALLVVRASRPLGRGLSFVALRAGSACARERDAPATAGDAPAPQDQLG